jgi:hypothetical protein
MLQDLIHHKGYANASLLKAIRRHEPAAQDPELRNLLHHINLANRFWLRLILGLPFAVEEESRTPESFEAVVAQYRETHSQEVEWLTHNEVKLGKMASQSVRPRPRGQASAEDLPARTRAHRLANLTSLG